MTLFRKAALDAQRGSDVGRIVLIRPITFLGLAIGGALCAAAIIAFLVVGAYTKRARVMGLLVPETGLIKVTAPVSGTLVEQHVREGQTVQAGQVLFVLDTERQLQPANGLTFSAGRELERVLSQRKSSLHNEQAQHQVLLNQQRGQLQDRLQALQLELTQLDQQIATQQERVTSSQSQLKRWQDLTEQKYAPEIALQQRRDEWLDQRNRLLALEQSRLQMRREQSSVASELQQLTTRAQLEGEQLHRAISDVDQAAINLETQRRVVVTAPVSGTATAILVEPGQAVSAQPLASIVPTQAALQAHLYAPSRAAGFVEPGQSVRLRYAGYPYQKFGQHSGTVLAVSRSPLSHQELPAPMANLGQQLGGEGVYRITVQLDQQHMDAYGKKLPLSVGMQLEADILQDTRRIVEWMFEPVLSVKGKWL